MTYGLRHVALTYFALGLLLFNLHSCKQAIYGSNQGGDDNNQPVYVPPPVNSYSVPQTAPPPYANPGYGSPTGQVYYPNGTICNTGCPSSPYYTPGIPPGY